MLYSAKPISLVMRKLKCFYCEEDQVFDMYAANAVFGIRHCAHHKENAQRDIRCFYHESEKVDINDLRKHPGISPILARFDNPIFIKRTNGDIDYDWTLRKSTTVFPLLMYKAHGQWCVPMKHESGISKDVPLKCFISDELKTVNDFSAEFCENIDEALKQLDNGIYKFEFEVVKVCDIITIEETDGVWTFDVGAATGSNKPRVFIHA